MLLISQDPPLWIHCDFEGSEHNNLDPADLPVKPDVGPDLLDPLDLLDPGPGAVFDLPCPEFDPAPVSCPALPGLLELLTFPEFDPAPVSCPALPGLFELHDALTLDPLFQLPLCRYLTNFTSAAQLDSCTIALIV